MIVLLDLEWIGENPIQMTQLAAKRVREDWTVENDLNILFQLEPESVLDPKHMALGGVGIDEYRMGTTEQEAMQRLCHWLDPADEIWTWAKSNIRVLEELWTRWMLEEPLPKTRAIANKVRKKLAPHGFLPHVLGERRRPQRAVDIFLVRGLGGRRHDSVNLFHLALPCLESCARRENEARCGCLPRQWRPGECSARQRQPRGRCTRAR